MQRDVPARRLSITYAFLTSILLLASAFYVWKTLHWTVTGDSTVMHYVNFLMDKGQAPYRDIIDINLPGCYFLEGWAMHIFGAGDLGWRFYDFFLLGLLIAAFVVIARPYGWFGGVLAGVVFALLHGSEGPRNAGQREEVMVVLIMVGYASLFSALRKEKAFLMLPFGFFIGLAASLKPTVAPLGLVLLLMALPPLKRRKQALLRYAGYGCLGLFAAAGLTARFLYKYHVFADFLAIARRLIPYYAGIGNKPFLPLMRFVTPHSMMLILLLGLMMTFFNRSRSEWESWERWALALGFAAGVASYIVQDKGFEYQAYSLEAFGLLWAGLEFAKSMRVSGLTHYLALTAAMVAISLAVTKYVLPIRAYDAGSAFPNALQADLESIGRQTLQKQVLCLDMVAGCLATLQRMDLVQNTSFIGDYMFFGPVGSPPLPFYRNMLWNDLHTSPPRVIVLTNMWLREGASFNKVNQWPELAAFIQNNYTLAATRSFSNTEFAYRLYLWKGSPAVTLAGQALAPQHK